MPDILELPGARVARFVSLGCWFGPLTDGDLTRRAVLNFAVYRSFLLHKYTSGCTAKAAEQALPQFAREAVRYHPTSRRHVGRWLHSEAPSSPVLGGPMDEVADEADAGDSDGGDAN